MNYWDRIECHPSHKIKGNGLLVCPVCKDENSDGKKTETSSGKTSIPDWFCHKCNKLTTYESMMKLPLKVS